MNVDVAVRIIGGMCCGIAGGLNGYMILKDKDKVTLKDVGKALFPLMLILFAVGLMK